MADDLERRVARLSGQLRVTQVIAVLGVATALASYVYGRWAMRRSAGSGGAQRVFIQDLRGSSELLPGRLLLRDGQGRLRVELGVEPTATHLVLTDSSGHAVAQLTAATPTEAGADPSPLSALALGATGEAQALLRAGNGGLVLSDGASDRVHLGFADSSSDLALASADGKQRVTLAAQPGPDPALTAHDDAAQAHLRVSLGGGTPAIELQDDAHSDGALLAPARLKLGGAGGKERVLTP